MEKQNLRVLLIEDNTGDAFIVKFYLDESKYANYEVIHEEDLKRGIELAAKEKFDIVLLDLHFADSDEINALINFQKEAPGNFVIVMTGMYTEDMGLEALKLGAQDYLLKGAFDSKVFNNALRYAYERYKANIDRSNLSDVFNRNINRFNILQELSDSYYFEVMVEFKQVFVSIRLNNFIIKSDKREFGFEEFSEFFENKEAILEGLNLITAGEDILKVTTSFFNRPVTVSITGKAIASDQYGGIIHFD